MKEEGYSFDSLDQYKRIRAAARHASNSQTHQEAITAYAAQVGCREETAAKYLAAAAAIRSCQSFFRTAQDEDAEATGEDVTRDDSWDYVAILSGGVWAEAIRRAFDNLDYREQVLVEQRNAVCMTCGRVSDLSTRKTFEALAVLFEGSSASGAERAYDRAIDKWVLIKKPNARDAYVHGKLNEQLSEVLEDVDSTFNEISADYIVVIE